MTKQPNDSYIKDIMVSSSLIVKYVKGLNFEEFEKIPWDSWPYHVFWKLLVNPLKIFRVILNQNIQIFLGKRWPVSDT